MLKLKKLFFLFKIVYNLLKWFFQKQNFLFQNFYFLLLLKASILILIRSFLLDKNVSLLVLWVSVQLWFLSLIIIKSVPLTHSFLGQFLVLIMNISFDFLNISLSILFGLRLEMIEWLLEFSLLFSFHPSKLNLNKVLFFCISFFQTLAILLPSHQLKFVL